MGLTTRLLTGIWGSLLLSACVAPQVGSPCPVRIKADPRDPDPLPRQQEKDLRACFSEITELHHSAKPQKDLDILFLIDNSPSMTPKQAALAEAIPKFIEKIDSFEANYHVGVATSDVGSYQAPGQPWTVSLGACNTFEGDDGTLQRVACTTRSNVSAAALAACTKLCPDPQFVPQGGKGFISKIGNVTNVPPKMVGGKDVGPIEAFKCIALVGDGGCGIEGQLEGAKRALDNHNPMNADFLRPNSVLAVIFITDEDDCSTSLKGRRENNPSVSPSDYPPDERSGVMACENPAGNPDPHYACYNPDYRCFARSTKCGQQLNQAGTKTGCMERPSYLEPVENYVRFFSALRPASKLVIGGIWTPKDGKVVITQRAMTTRTQDLNRAEGADAACLGPDTYCDGQAGCFFGRPQHRMSKFAAQFSDSIEVSVCDVSKYPSALDRIADLIDKKLKGYCLGGKPAMQGGKPVCIVGDVDINTPNNSPDVAFPPCSDGCCNGWASAEQAVADDPTVVAACAGETRTCYCAVEGKPRMGGTEPNCKGSAIAGVWRPKGQEAKDGKEVNFKCAIAR